MRRSPLTVFAAALALLLPVLFTTVVAVGPWLLRYVTLCLVIAVGLPALLALALDRAHRRTALLGVGFAAWCLLCAALSSWPAVSFLGIFGQGTGAFFAVSLIAAWAIGSSTDEGGALLIENALLVAAAINVVVALAEMTLDLQSLGLELFDKRSPGLLGNPVFLAELLAGAFWLVLLRSRDRWPLWALFSLGIGAALQVSGSRLSLAVVAVAVALAFTRVPWRFVAIMAMALVLGLGAGTVLTSHGGGVSTSSRLSQPVGGGGNRARFDTWRSALPAIAKHPVVGVGPGNFGAASGPRRTLRLARDAHGAVFIDAHNIVVEYATTTGLPGAVLLVAFLVVAVARRRTLSVPLFGFAVAVFVGHLIEPQNVALTPLAFLTLGAAARAGVAPRPIGPGFIRLAVAGVGVLAAAELLVGGYYLQEASLDFNLHKAKSALRLLPPWPQTAALVAKVYAFQSKTIRHRPDLARQSRHWQGVAARRYPPNALAWEELAEGQLGDGARAKARATLSVALYWDPWSTRGLNDLATLEITELHWDRAAAAARRSLLVDPSQREAKGLVEQSSARGRG